MAEQPPERPADGGAGQRSDDEIFAELVGGWSLPVDTEPPWPAQEDLPQPEPEPEPAAAAPAPAATDEDQLEDEDGDEEAEHYVPPPPPPIGRLSAAASWCLVAILGGALFLLVPSMLHREVSTELDTLGVGAIVVGVAGLVWRLREDDADDDDGAVL